MDEIKQIVDCMNSIVEKKAVNIIREEFAKRGLKVFKIILFGSRAKGEAKEDSDWDFLIIVSKKLNFNEKWSIIDNIKVKLAQLKLPNDIFIKSSAEVEESKEDVGRITYYAIKEGIEIK